MILPDVNLLIYACDAAARQHEAARQWWDTALSGDDPGSTDNDFARFPGLNWHNPLAARRRR